MEEESKVNDTLINQIVVESGSIDNTNWLKINRSSRAHSMEYSSVVTDRPDKDIQHYVEQPKDHIYEGWC